MQMRLLLKSESMMNHISLFMDDNGKVDIDRSAQNWIDLGHVLMMLGMSFRSYIVPDQLVNMIILLLVKRYE